MASEISELNTGNMTSTSIEAEYGEINDNNRWHGVFQVSAFGVLWGASLHLSGVAGYWGSWAVSLGRELS